MVELVRQKNVATYIVFPLVDADGDLVSSSGNPDSEIDAWADGSAPDGFADCTNEATEIGSTGIYYLSLEQGEMNHDYIVIQVKSDDAKTQVILIRTMTGDPLKFACSSNPTSDIDDILTDTGTTLDGKLDTIDGIVDSILVDTGTTLDGKLDTIDGIVDSVLEDTGTTLPATLTTIEGKIDTVDTNVDAVLVDTGTTLPATLTTIEGKIDTVDTNVDAVLVDTGTTLDGKINTISTNVDAVLVDTGTTLPATLSTMDGKIDTVDGIVDDILVDTAEIGTAGAGLTDLGGMSTSMKAEVESECNDALVAVNLDHLCKTATAAADMTTEVADNTILSRIIAGGDTSKFNPSLDALLLISRLAGRVNTAWEYTWSDDDNSVTNMYLYDTAANTNTNDHSTGKLRHTKMTATHSSGKPSTAKFTDEDE